MIDLPLRIVTNADPDRVPHDVQDAIERSEGTVDDGVIKTSPHTYTLYFRLPVESVPKFKSALLEKGLELTEESEALLRATNNGRDFAGAWPEEAGERLIYKFSAKLVVNFIH